MLLLVSYNFYNTFITNQITISNRQLDHSKWHFAFFNFKIYLSRKIYRFLFLTIAEIIGILGFRNCQNSLNFQLFSIIGNFNHKTIIN